MNTVLVGLAFRRGSPEWRLIQRWTVFTGQERRKLLPKEKAVFSQKRLSDSVYLLVACVREGDPEKYGRPFYFGIPFNKEHCDIVRRMWEKFKQEERFLFAEVFLSR